MGLAKGGILCFYETEVLIPSFCTSNEVQSYKSRPLQRPKTLVATNKR